jgi:glutamine cyclotransferase
MLQLLTRVRSVLLWLVIPLIGLGIFSTSAAPGDVLQSFPAPGATVRDLAWDGTHLWLLDDGAAKIYQIDTATGAVIADFAIELTAAKGITCDSDRLWLSDAAEAQALKVEPQSGSIEKRIDTPRLTGNTAGNPSVLAWHDDYLWCGTIAGWSSRVNQIDPDTGEVIRWFFSRGFPEGIAIDGESIWTVTHNAGDRVGLVYRHDYESGMFLSQFDTPGRQPAGLAFDGEAIWCADRETGSIYRLAIN